MMHKRKALALIWVGAFGCTVVGEIIGAAVMWWVMTR